MSYRPDTLEGIIEFCEAEGQPHESLLALAEVVGATETLAAIGRDECWCGEPKGHADDHELKP